MLPRVSGVYFILNLFNRKQYVGSTQNLYRRWISHRFELENGSHHCVPLQRAWLKYGAGNFEFRVFDLLPRPEALRMEQVFLDMFFGTPALYNTARNAACSALGRICSTETRAKIAKSTLGKKRSPLTKQRLSESLAGRVFSEAHLENMSTSRKQLFNEKPDLLAHVVALGKASAIPVRLTRGEDSLVFPSARHAAEFLSVSSEAVLQAPRRNGNSRGWRVEQITPAAP